MKFPITRAELQTYDIEKVNSERILDLLDKRLSAIVKNICEEFERSFSTNCSLKKYVYRHISQALMVPSGLPSTVKLSETDVLNILFDKLKELFVDCTFTVDPLKTYLIISWE